MENRIKELRLQENMSVEHLAVLLGISKYHLYNIERGKRSLSLPIAKRARKVFNTSLDELFFCESISQNEQRGGRA